MSRKHEGKRIARLILFNGRLYNYQTYIVNQFNCALQGTQTHKLLVASSCFYLGILGAQVLSRHATGCTSRQFLSAF